MVPGDFDLNSVIERFQSYAPGADTALLTKAYRFSCEGHSAQKRASNEPYFIHCLAVTNVLMDWRLDSATICAGLLHDIMEDTKVTYDDLKADFSEEIANLVAGVTKIERLQFTNLTEFQAENWRKMMLATAKDIRVILIKLADRLHNIRTIHYLPAEDQLRIAQETLTLYAPIADRLGIFATKSELEDLSFAIIEPHIFGEISQSLDKQTEGRDEYLKRFGEHVTERLKKLNVSFRCMSRPKHVYSIYRKMLRQNKNLNEIEDTMGIRLITDTIANCYSILGEMHAAWKPVPNSFTDYIAQPKSNMYQSIHTTVWGPGDTIVEIQIRTEEMHRRAEYGIAAHWKYKLKSHGNVRDKDLEMDLNWLREWLEAAQDLENPAELLETLKTELKVHQIFVFTPRMEVKPLPEGASPVDFAYAVHTDIGNQCMGAKINGKIAKLDSELKNGDICEILVRKNARPNEDWLKFVKTSKARSRIRRFLKDLKSGDKKP
ncbi:MAG: bifunctional (p)ppGpp synthetase/guanosine-3',5'-bis(diphosphate) 3'-pyrophosphohydrolase [Elusimicrobia bacterium]|nr:bifunctional (p)ppGpp synthetase/guanosine-3',5'-bis(diphosphate) 3'-pyrophosphohydrolase [Elusimicrobiota bacterium]